VFRNKWHKLFDEVEAIESPLLRRIRAPAWVRSGVVALLRIFAWQHTVHVYGLPEIEFGALRGLRGHQPADSNGRPLIGHAGWSWRVKQISADRGSRDGRRAAVLPGLRSFRRPTRAFCMHLASLPVMKPSALAKLAIDMATSCSGHRREPWMNMANSILFHRRGAEGAPSSPPRRLSAGRRAKAADGREPSGLKRPRTCGCSRSDSSFQRGVSVSRPNALAVPFGSHTVDGYFQQLPS